MNNFAKEAPPAILAFARRPSLPVWKRTIDILICAAVLPLLVPLVLLMSIIARCYAPGPIFFRQERVGYLGQKFTMFKFRTMKVNSDSASHRDHIQAAIRSGKPLQKMDAKGDSRLIPFGRILRATGLDELPQIVNILKGEMSVVGPRPCVAYEAELFTPAQRERFDAVPGITGLWQVSGKNSLTLNQMIELDIRYARSLSFVHDFSIMLRTIPTIWKLVVEAVKSRAKRSTPESTNRGKEPYPTWDSVVGARVIARDSRRQLIQFRLPSALEACPSVSQRAQTKDHTA